MKKILLLVFVAILVVGSLTGCGSQKDKAEIAMITDAGEIDDRSFNQSTYDGIKEYAEENGKTYKYYKPTEVSDDAYMAAIDLAVKAGAKIIVTPGYLFEPAIYYSQEKYPEVKFVLIDGSPNDGDYSSGSPTYRIDENTYSIFFAEEESGFLAGYAAVKDGYTKLGFMGGMAVPAVIRYGYGFVQGAEYAAQEMGIESVEIKYHYTGDFAATPKNQTTAASWYADGTEAIFACGGNVFGSVAAAAEATENGQIIGVDIDQSNLSERVITSAMKELGVAVQIALADFYADTFKGGVVDTYDISVGSVGLPFANSKFSTFTEADYEAIYAKLVAGEVEILGDADADDATGLPAEIVAVTLVE